jgi:hypothetical protein
MDDQMQASVGAELEVGRRLDDFARARLTPSDGAKARSRARVMREVRLAIADQAAAAVAAAELDRRRATARRTAMRRGGGLLLAATLSLGVVGGALAGSGAGGPLYGTRIWLETLALPSDPAGRAAAELTRLESRLAELEAAVRSGDRGAVAAALAAYEQIMDEAMAGADASGNEAAIERLLAALNRHVENLQRVAGQVPPQAAEVINRNIERAILHNGAAIERIESKSGKPRNGGRGGGGGNAGNPSTGPAGGQEPAANPTPDPTPKPTKSPTPTKPPTPTTPPAEPPAGPSGGPPTEERANDPPGQDR